MSRLPSDVFYVVLLWTPPKARRTLTLRLVNRFFFVQCWISSDMVCNHDPVSECEGIAFVTKTVCRIPKTVLTIVVLPLQPRETMERLPQASVTFDTGLTLTELIGVDLQMAETLILCGQTCENDGCGAILPPFVDRLLLPRVRHLRLQFPGAPPHRTSDTNLTSLSQLFSSVGLRMRLVSITVALHSGVH